jgi:hypothetical protein
MIKQDPLEALSTAPSTTRASAEPSYLSHRGGFWVGHTLLARIWTIDHYISPAVEQQCSTGNIQTIQPALLSAESPLWRFLKPSEEALGGFRARSA